MRKVVSAKVILVSIVAMLFSIASLSNVYAQTLVEENDVDPWEGWNRGVDKFNNVADKYVLKPVAIGYKIVTPRVVDQGVTNVFDNFKEIPSSANAVLQAKPKSSGKAISRFLINATLGFFGIFDVATALGIERQEEDFGQTLATWGVPSGPYVVLPFLGPSTVRDGLAGIPDAYLDPAIGQVSHLETRLAILALKAVDTRADLLTAEALITGDRYTFLRNAYLQQRDFLIHDGNPEDDFGNANEDEEDEDWLEDE